MSDFKDLKNLTGLDQEISKEFLDQIKLVNPMENMTYGFNQERNKALRALQESREEKEKEELRRHKETIQALKEAGKNGATIIVGDHANGVQILQNSDGANQAMTNSQTFNYEKTLDILEEIREYFDYPKFKETFGKQSEVVQQIVNQTIDAVYEKENPTLIMKSLKVLKDLAIGTSGSIIATGILGLLSSII